MRYSETSTHSTVFGLVEIKYIPESKTETFASAWTDGPQKVVASHYSATIQDGIWNGWTATGPIRENAMANLMKLVAERYGHDMVHS